MSDLPSIPGVIGADEICATAASIRAVQQPDGGIPWAATDPHIDVWNHIEAAMALLVAGEVEAAERAFAWCRAQQRADGSWPMRITSGSVEDASGDTNMSAYLAVGVWHHWLIRRDRGFVDLMWPHVRAALDFVTGMQLPFGGIAWSREGGGTVNEEALLAGSASIYHSLRAGLALADLVDEPQGEWELVAGRLGHAVREHEERFLDKASFSMDWYYPVLGGVLRDQAAHDRLRESWGAFVVDGLGVRCLDTNPWITGAETCELAIALEAIGERDRALALFVDVQQLRHESGSYWTGLVYPEQVNWPAEHTTYTAAAVILAADALASATPGADIFRTSSLPEELEEIALECDCSGDRVAGVTPYAD